MTDVLLGRTGIRVNKNGFGALPIQRVTVEEATRLLRKAYHGGMSYYDSARAYTDSEEKIGIALHDVRDKIYIATKTGAKTAEEFWTDLHKSLQLLQTDYIDVYQFHNPSFCPRPGGDDGLYDAIMAAKKQGKIRFAGITNHRLNVAREAVESGLYDTLQFPFCHLSDDVDIALVESCRQADVGFVAMKALSGGMITNSRAAYAFMAQYSNVLPIWGVQREQELDEFLSYIQSPPAMNAELQAVIDGDRSQLLGEFCRGCGYCMPCPVGIEINMSARISHLIRRSPSAPFLTEAYQEVMRRVEDCLHCGQCISHCPYQLDPPAMLEKGYHDYKEILAGKPI